MDGMDVSENSGTPKSFILIGFSIINHPFWGSPIFGNTRMGMGSCFGHHSWERRKLDRKEKRLQIQSDYQKLQTELAETEDRKTEGPRWSEIRGVKPWRLLFCCEGLRL